MKAEQSELLTTREVAAFLRVHVETVYRLMARGSLVSHRVGRVHRFRQGDIDAYLMQPCGVQAAHQYPSPGSADAVGV